MPRETQYGLLHSSGGTHVGLPLVGVSVEAEVHDFICEVNVSQSYKNTNASDIEAVYHFPLDEASAVCGFRAEYEDGVVVDAIIKEKSEARQEYQQAVRSGKQAQLLESVRPDIFTMTVGRMPAGSRLTIKITYIALLKAEGSASRFLLPTHIAERYSPAHNTAVPVPSVTSTFRPLYGLDVRIKFTTQSNIKQLTSPSHPSVIATSISGKTGQVTFPEGMAMGTDLIVLCDEEQAHEPRACVEIAKDGSLAGLVTLFPEIEFRDVPREIVFIIDRSGSMMGIGGNQNGKTQMESAREALMLFLRALPASCTFNIIGFGSKHSSLFPTSQPYNDHTLDQATRYAETMAADMGGTEILKPLQYALRGSNSKQPRQIFVLTDGQVSNESAVFDCVRSGSSMGARTFCLGIGGGVSHHLVEGIARAGKGTASFVTSGAAADELHVKVLAQLKQALQPSLDNVSVKWNFPAKPVPVVDVPPPSAPVKTLLGYRSPDLDKPTPPKPVVPRAFPSIAPPVFNRERFVSFALFPAGHTEVPTSVTITASTPDGPLAVELPIVLEEVLSGDIAHRLAARIAIREYEDSFKGVGAVSKAEALTLALNNSLASSQTSFVAVRTEPAVPSELGAPMQRLVLPQPVDEDLCSLSLQSKSMYLPASRNSVRSAAAPALAYTAYSCSPAQDTTVSWRACPEPKTSSWGMRRAKSSKGSGGSRGGSGMKEAASAAATGFSSMFRGGGGGGGFLSSIFGLGASKQQESESLGSCKDAEDESWNDADDSMDCDFDCAERRSSSLVQVGCYSAPAPAPPPAAPPAAKRPAPARKRSAKEEEQKSGGGKKPEGVFGLCLLQRANGSFLLDSALAAIIGASVEDLEQAVRAILANVAPQTSVDESSCGTLAALLAMRVLFSHEKSVYELQENKALAYLASRTSDGKGFKSVQVEAGVGAITRVLLPAKVSQGN